MISKVLDGSSFVDEFLEYMLSNYSDKNSQLSVDILDVKNKINIIILIMSPHKDNHHKNIWFLN